VPDVAQLGDAFANADGAVAGGVVEGGVVEGGVVEGGVDEVVPLSGFRPDLSWLSELRLGSAHARSWR
jgi:hypothetical protein